MENAEISLGYVQLTNLTVATGLTIPAGTRLILIQAESQDVRWRDDGTAPTASVGMVLAAGAGISYTGGNPISLSFIESLPSAKLNVTFYK